MSFVKDLFMWGDLVIAMFATVSAEGFPFIICAWMRARNSDVVAVA